MAFVQFDRVVCIVLDGCGAGPAPDAADFGDFGQNEGDTLRNVYNAVGGFDTPLLEKMGFLAAARIPTQPEHIEAVYGRLRELSIGKDTVTGHWEMMGIHLEKPFPVYPNGFPIPLVREFEQLIGRQTIGNVAASGTEIINRLGKQHMDSGCPIIYTSADSVFQIACHEAIVPVNQLYEICKIARHILVEPNNVGRVIARPFIGDPESGFTRTTRRKDFPIPPPHNIIDQIADKFGPVFGIGVIPEVFAYRGFRPGPRTQSNAEHQRSLLSALSTDARFIWANYEDFDMLYGHRNDPQGFAQALEDFDSKLGEILGALRENDLLILTADHGSDPTTPSTDHTREYIPVSIWHLGMKSPHAFGDCDGFWHIGATVATALGIQPKLGRTLIQHA